MQDINPWALATVALLAIMLAHLLRRRRPTRSSRDGAYRRGLEYALAELHLAEDGREVAERLAREAESGRDMDPSPFDDAIMDVVREHAHRDDLQSLALVRVGDRLQSMLDLGEASQSEVGVGMNVVEELLGGCSAEGETVMVVTEYLHLRGGRPVLVRRPLSDWPSWADDMRADRLEQRS